MLPTLIPLYALLTTALATPSSPKLLAVRQQTQQININVQISDSQFKSFENANALKQYLQGQGYNYAFNYNQLSQGVASIDRYFATKAAQTTTSNTNNGFFAEDNTAVQTDSDSTSLKGGPSYTNISLSATENLVQAISFSDGDAGTAGGAIQRLKDISSTSTSGSSNSTATVTATTALVQISAEANVENARQNLVVDGGPQDALTGGVCAAGSNGASARSEIITTMKIPVNVSGQPTSGSTAASFCEAGISGRSSGQPDGSGTSSSITQAALTDGGVSAGVVCNGGAVRRAVPVVSWNVRFQGTYTAAGGFRGTFTGVRTASAQTSCS